MSSRLPRPPELQAILTWNVIFLCSQHTTMNLINSRCRLSPGPIHFFLHPLTRLQGKSPPWGLGVTFRSIRRSAGRARFPTEALHPTLPLLRQQGSSEGQVISSAAGTVLTRLGHPRSWCAALCGGQPATRRGQLVA